MVELEPHDPVWIERFEDQRDRIVALAPDSLLGVFHVGSTAVPDLLAKPALDVLVVFPDYDPARELAAGLDREEFEWKRDDPDWLLCSRRDPYRIHVHLRPRDADTWRDQVVFRELLQDDADARRTYEAMKREAASAHPGDEEAYTDYKEETILELVDRAYREGYDERLPEFA